MAVLVVALVAGGVAGGAWARRGFYVDFDDRSGESGEVTVFQGRRGGVLWIEPTVAARGALDRDDLADDGVDAVLDHPRFGSLDDAVDFVRGLERVEEQPDTSDPDLPTEPVDRSDDTDPTDS